jgi:hypothetical protein
LKPSRRILGLAVAGLVLAGATVLLLQQPRRDAVARGFAGLDKDGPPALPSASRLLAPDEPPQGLVWESERRAKREPAIEVAPAPPEKKEGVSGTWTVVDGAGKEFASEDGWFEFTLEEDPAVRRQEVRKGQWESDLAPGVVIDLVRLELGGRTTVPWEVLQGVETDAGPVHLRATWIKDAVVHVLDAETGLDLTSVEVWIASTADGNVHPELDRPAQRVCDAAPSPVVLPPPEYLDEYGATDAIWVRSPGYGWGMKSVPRARGGEFALALRSGGNLRVLVTGVQAPLVPFLRLRNPALEDLDQGGVLFERRLDGPQEIVLDSLAAGPYRVAIEVGHKYRFARALDGRVVEVRARETAEVELRADSFVFPGNGPFEGQVLVPPAWEFDDFGLYAQIVGQPSVDGTVERYVGKHEMHPIDAQSGLYTWSFGEQQIGSYALRFNPLGTRATVEVTASGTGGYRLEVPEPARLEVVLFDEESGAPAEDSRVSWIPGQQDITVGGVLNGVLPRQHGVFEVLAPAGECEVWCFSTRYRFRREVLQLHAGSQSIHLGLKRAEGILLGLREGETILALPDVDVRIVAVEGEGQGDLVYEDEESLEQRYVVTAAGRYRVELDVPAGYQPLAPVEVDIPPGTFLPLVLEVRRL